MSTDNFPRLRQTKGRNGKALPGLWECDIVRMERDIDGWAAQVPMRQIGETVYWEFRAAHRGGVWVSIGHYRTREDAVRSALILQSGLYVWRMAYSTGDVKVPGLPYRWEAVAEEIAKHPSVTGTGRAAAGREGPR